jgi:hypothetical protein
MCKRTFWTCYGQLSKKIEIFGFRKIAHPSLSWFFEVPQIKAITVEVEAFIVLQKQ